MRTSEEIIQSFIDSGFKHMDGIPGNRLFVTDNTCSTLAWVEENVVIEYYMLFPNLTTPLHQHPFDNQMIYISGDLVAYRVDKDGVRTPVRFDDSKHGHLSKMMPIGGEHGFRVGERGAVIYNIQIWPTPVENPLSAAIEYMGGSMGPKHDELVALLKPSTAEL